MRIARVLMVLLVAVALTACGDDDTTADATGEGLTGVLGITAGECAGEAISGSHFKMVQPGGSVGAGPFVANSDSACADKTVTALAPGTDGGLRLGTYQPRTDPAFEPGGSTTAVSVITATTFFGVGFGISTNEQDPQSGETVPPPALEVVEGELTGDLSAVSVSWNGQDFNQGAPKPGSSDPAGITGTYDADTGAYTLEWTSLIEGGPFNGFTGIWHLEGTFTAA